jgi:hypothetical protein
MQVICRDIAETKNFLLTRDCYVLQAQAHRRGVRAIENN